MKTAKKTEKMTHGCHLIVQRMTTLILVLFLAGCSLPSQMDPAESAFLDEVNDFTPPSVDITFNLELNQALADGEGIAIEILDEVSGLPYNFRRFELSKVNDQLFKTKLSFPGGSVVKYRYVKLGDNIIPEATSDGNPVRYRMFYAESGSLVTDIIQKWHGDSPMMESGTLTGVLLDRTTGLPIPDILVSAGGQLTFSDANGKFSLQQLPTGVHNVLFYAIDGLFKPYQQGALISAGLTTPAEVKLQSMPLINITLNVTVPNEVLGAPIYLAGNLSQLGNTFTGLEGSMSLKPKRMPALSPKEETVYTIDLHLYQGTDLRYKFTMGDGYWNAEQHPNGGVNIRQLIIPDHDITLDLNVFSWRSPGIEPVSFQVHFPVDSSPQDEKFIQLYHADWMEPLPLWPTGGGNYLYILFSPLDNTSPITYRFCRNDNCQQAINSEIGAGQNQVQPGANPHTVSLTVEDWENWQFFEPGSEVIDAYLSEKSSQFSTYIELTPEMDPSWRVYAPTGLKQIADLGSEFVIFSPQWFFEPGKPVLHPRIGATPFHYELTAMLNAAQSLGLKRGLFPQPGPGDAIDLWWEPGPISMDYWQHWSESYHQFVLNYANIAKQTGTETLILGGKSVLPAFSDGIMPDGSDSDLPEIADEFWTDLVDEVRALYNGNLIWAVNTHQEMDPLPDFIDKFDGVYIVIDSPLAEGTSATFEQIAEGFIQVIDNFVYEVYRSTALPITLALAYPSVDGATQGCARFDNQCYTDGLFLSNESEGLIADLEEQALIYNAIFPVIASRDWITGISIRGYEPTVIIHDSTSSIAGKPAADVIQYWFLGLRSE